ncbi:MAG: hypothetical protein WC716_14850 [Chitinophagaceae bacterium]|jgi:hypothetical protein
MKIKYTFFILLIFTVSCNQDEKNKKLAEHYLGDIHLDKYGVKEVAIKKLKLAPEYSFPFYIYISWNIDPTFSEVLFNDLGLVKYDSTKIDYRTTMCIRYPDIKKFWTIAPLTYGSALKENHPPISWWNVDTNNFTNVYASYYKLNNSGFGKPILCKGKYDGRIVGQYALQQNRIYILIECFLKP